MTQALINDNELTDVEESQYLSLSLGDVNLLVLQTEIISIDSLQSIELDKPTKYSIGWLDYEYQKIPVYSFTEQLGIEHSISSNKSICVVLKGARACVSVMCVEAVPFKNKIIKTSLLPECMQSASCPIVSLCLYKDEKRRGIQYVVSAESIVGFINEYNVL